MVSPAGGFAQGLERGWRMGESAERSRYQKEDRDYTKKQRDMEDRINREIGNALAMGAGPQTSPPEAKPQAPAFSAPEAPGLEIAPGVKPPAAGGGVTPAPMSQPAGLEAAPGTKPAAMSGAAPQQMPDLVGQLNGAMGYLTKAAQDPKNADIAAALFDKMGVLASSSKRFGDVMLNQARQKAMPHIKVLYSPGASDEQKSAAVGALMNEVFPDGDDYYPQVVGKEVRLLDSTGKPVMGADGKPRTLSMDDLDQMLTYGLSTPDDYISSVQESINARREQLLAQSKLDEQRAYDERKEDRTYRRNRTDELSDRAYTAGQAKAREERAAARALEKEGRDEKRDTVKAKRNFIAKAMAAYDKDAAFSAPNPEARAAYLEQVRAIAKQQFEGGAEDPTPGKLNPGDAIEVDLGPGLETPTRAAPAAPAPAAPELPPIPMPGQDNEAPTGPSGVTYDPEIGRGVHEIAAGLEALQGWKEKQRTSGYKQMADKFRQGVSAGKVDPALVQRLRSVPDRVLQRDYGLSPKEIAAIKQGGG